MQYDPRTTPCPPPPMSERDGVAEALSALDLYALGVRASDIDAGFDVDLLAVEDDE